jgi:hypothetical protein
MKSTRLVPGALLATGILAVLMHGSAAYGRSPTSGHSCSQACTHVEDCPKVSCECEHGSASDVAVCDVQTKCCWSVTEACKQFCRAHHQMWTGRTVPETPGTSIPTPSSGANGADMTPTNCQQPCEAAADCPTMSCQCQHETASHVAACDVKTKCCGTARIVCEHFCGVTKDTWTGKVIEDAAPRRTPDSDEPEGDAGDR